MNRLTTAFAIGVTASLFAPAIAVAQDDDWEVTLATYREWLERPSLWKRTAGRQRFANTLDPRALEVLVRSYSKPEDPQDRNRYLITSIAMRAFRTKADEVLLAGWRKKHNRADDAWMWFETLRPTAQRRFDELRTLAVGRGDPFLRAVALEALADVAKDGHEPDGLRELCLELLAEPPRKEIDRALMTEGVAHILLARRRRVRSQTWKPVALALIRQLDDEDIPDRTKVVLSRYFSQIFGVSNLGYESHWWMNELERDPSATRPRGRGTTTTVPFYSIRAFGYRFVYVIDASDSMLRRVTDREKRDIGPVTGETPEPKQGDGSFVPGENELDWSRIVHRFDVGREFVRMSLLSLRPEHSFAVVLFGDEAEPLRSTPKLVKATAQNVRAAIAELQAIDEDPPTASRPDGVLRGKTNLHAGLARAFEITRSGEARKSEYIDPKAMLDGCDSIFLLSDGAPSWDDFAELDARDEGDQAGDQEMHIKFENRDNLIFYGPYAHPPFDYLVQDIERMNMFRKAEIHCVGIGEAYHHLLQRIARVGGGKALKIEGERGR